MEEFDNETFDALVDSLKKFFPEKMIVDITEFESDEHQSYKYLYENQANTLTELNNQIASMTSELEIKDRRIYELGEENESLKHKCEEQTVQSKELIEFINKFNETEIFIVNDIQTNMSGSEENDLRQLGINHQVETLKKSISDNPGVYGNKRPSWFTPVGVELSKENVIKKNKAETIKTLKEKILFWKNKKVTNLDIKEAKELANEYDHKRMEHILQLLNSKCSNEEMYLKYMLLSPGIDKEYFKTLDGAEKLGIDARLVISLLEQPNDFYNREIIESYVSKLHKGNEYNYKQSLAEELIEGKWQIKAKVNGIDTKFQLVPVEILETFNSNLTSINYCANLTQIESENKSSENIEDKTMNSFDEEMIQDEDVNENTSVAIEFDDSLLF